MNLEYRVRPCPPKPTSHETQKHPLTVSTLDLVIMSAYSVAQSGDVLEEKRCPAGQCGIMVAKSQGHSVLSPASPSLGHPTRQNQALGPFFCPIPRRALTSVRICQTKQGQNLGGVASDACKNWQLLCEFIETRKWR